MEHLIGLQVISQYGLPYVDPSLILCSCVVLMSHINWYEFCVCYLASLAD